MSYPFNMGNALPEVREFVEAWWGVKGHDSTQEERDRLIQARAALPQWVVDDVVNSDYKVFYDEEVEFIIRDHPGDLDPQQYAAERVASLKESLVNRFANGVGSGRCLHTRHTSDFLAEVIRIGQKENTP